MKKQLRKNNLTLHIARTLRTRAAALSVPLSFPAAALMTFGSAFAGPTGGVVVTGQGAISTPAVGSTVIDQGSQQLHVNWNTFDVAASESVQFNQPSPSAVALNRILDQNPSQIFGRIEANGQVILVNPNGLLFGHSAQLNVGSLVASSLDVIDFDAASGRYSFGASGADPGAVLNEGLINAAPGGSVTLLGGRVSNSGAIIADFGAVNLAAGRAATLDLAGDGLLRLEVDADLLANEAGAAAAVDNSGTVQANGGRVLLTAQAVEGVFENLVNNTGVVRANRIDNSGGAIRLMGAGGTVRSSGALDASAGDAVSTGGTVEVLGEHVGLFGNALVDVSGATGGGTALIGGDYQGANPDVLNAARTYVGADAVIDADAGASGDGGKVIAWADELTRFDGSIVARGGAAGGDGGFAEVSGKESLVFRGDAQLSATAGRAGELLLDPRNITVEEGGSGDPVDNTYAFDEDEGDDITIAPTTITGILAGGTTVTLQAHNDITVSDSIDGSGSATAGGGLTFQAGDDIFIDADVRTNDGAIQFTAGDGDAGPRTGADGDEAPTGEMTLLSGVTLSAGDAPITLNSDGDMQLLGTVSGNAITANSGGTLTLGTLDAGAGAVSLSAASAILDDGVNATRVTGGALTMNATAIGAADVDEEIDTDVVSVDATSTNGDIFVTEANELALTASAIGGVVEVQTTNGALTVTSVAADDDDVTLTAGGAGNGITLSGAVDAGVGDVTLTAAGAIGGAGIISGNALSLDGSAIGGSGARLNTNVETLNATSTEGDIYISEADGLELTAEATGGEIDVLTTDGALTLISVAADDADITLTAGGAGNGVTLSGGVDAGAGNVTLTAAGAISGGGVISANALTASGSVIGTSGTRLSTDVDSLNATSTSGGIFVTEANGLSLTAEATSGVVEVQTNNGAVEVNTLSGSAATLVAGGAGSALTINGAVDVGAGAVSLTAGGSITDGGGGASITAGALTLSGASLGSAVDRLDTDVDSLSATASSGDVYLTDADDLTLTNVSAMSAGAVVDVTSATGDIVVGSVSAAAAVTLDAAAGSIVDDNNDTTVISAGDATLTAANNIGTVTNFDAEDDADVGSSIDVQTNGMLSAVVDSNAGEINLNISGTPTLAAGAITLGGGTGRAGAVVLQSSGNLDVSGLAAGAINIGADNTTSVGLRSGGVLTLPAGGGFTDQSAARLLVRGATDVIDNDAAPRELSFATTSLDFRSGAAGGATTLNTAVGHLDAFIGGGQNLTVNESDALTLGAISTTGDIIITAAGAISDDSSDLTRISGNAVTLSGTALGGDEDELDTQASTLTATASSGGVYVREADSLTLTANAMGGAVDVQTNNGALTVSSASGSGVTLDADGALNVNGAVNGGGDNVSLSAGGVLTLNGSVSAGAGDVSLTAGDAIVAGIGNQISGDDLTATGSAIGASGARLNTTVNSLNATSTSGGIYVTATDALTLTADASGAVDVQTTNGALTVNTVSGSSARLAAGGVGSALSITGSIDAGTGAVNLTADGAITDGTVGPTITAGALTLSGASIGNAANRLDTEIASLTAAAATGDVYIAETDGLNLADVSALGAGADVNVTSATGAIVVESVNAADTVTLTSTSGAINDDADNATRITANALTLNAGENIGAAGANAQIDTDVTSLTAAAGAGGVYVGELNGLTLASATAPGGDVSVTSATGDIVVVAVSAQDAVNLSATAGSINDDGDNATRISANTLTLTAGGAIGAANALDAIDTNVTSLSAAAGNSGVFINEQNGLRLSNVSANGVDSNLIVISDSGDIVVGAVSAQDAVTLIASSGSINDDDNNATRIAATALTLTAGGAIGAAGASEEVDTQVGSLTATAGDGGVYVGELDGLMLANVSASGESNDVSVTSASGDIVVGAVSAPDAVTLIAAAGSILDDASNATRIVGDALTLSAGASIGAAGADNEIDTEATVLTATAAAGDVRIGELNGVTLANVSAAGAGREVAVSSATGDIISASVDAEGAVTLSAVTGSILDDGDDATAIAGGAVSLAAGSSIGTVADLGAADIAEIGSSIDVQTDGALSASIASSTGQVHLNIFGSPTVAAGAIRLGTGTGRAGQVVLQSEGNLDLAGLSAGAMDIGDANTTSVALRSGGVLTLPSDGGFTDQPAHRLLVSGATDVVDGDAGSRELALQASALDFRSGAAGGSTTLNTSVDRLDASVGNGQDLIVNETDGLTLGAISVAGGDFTLNAGGGIVDDGDDLTRIVSDSATLSGAAIGASDDALNTQVNTLTASATGGGVFISESDALVLTANSVGVIDVRNDDGALTINAVSGDGVRLTAGDSGGALVLNGAIDGGAGEVVLTAGTSGERGAIVADADSQISGGTLTVLGSTLGASDARLNTNVASLNATSTSGGVFVSEMDALALTANSAGAVDVQTDNGALAVNSATGNGVTLSAGGAGSGIALNGTVDGGAEGVTLIAGTEASGGAITAGAGGLITGSSLTMTGSAIGSAGAALRTDTDVLTANASAGGVHINEQNGLTLADVGAANDVMVTSATGDITVNTVAAVNAVALTASAGAILDDGDDATRISGNALTLSARSLGAAPTALDSTMRLDTDVTTLTATATSGGVFIDELNGLDIVNVQATGGAAGDIELLTRGGDLNLRNVNASDTLLLAAGSNIFAAPGGNPITARVAELRAGAADPEGGRIGTLAQPLDLHLSAGASLRLFVPQTVSPDDPDRGPATLPSPGVSTTLNYFSSLNGQAVQAGFGQFEGFGETQFTSPAEVLLRTLQNQTGTVQAGLNIDWASFDPDVSLFGTLDPAVCLPGDQRDEEVTTPGCL